MNANRLRGLISRHVTCQRRVEWAGTETRQNAQRTRREADEAQKALYAYIAEIESASKVTPIETPPLPNNISMSLQRLARDAHKYRQVLVVAIENAEHKPALFSFGDGASALEEIGALVTAARMRSQGETP
jgi:hypothetical protein